MYGPRAPEPRRERGRARVVADRVWREGAGRVVIGRWRAIRWIEPTRAVVTLAGHGAASAVQPWCSGRIVDRLFESAVPSAAARQHRHFSSVPVDVVRGHGIEHSLGVCRSKGATAGAGYTCVRHRAKQRAFSGGGASFGSQAILPSSPSPSSSLTTLRPRPVPTSYDVVCVRPVSVCRIQKAERRIGDNCLLLFPLVRLFSRLRPPLAWD
jgi:hypothetical protein